MPDKWLSSEQRQEESARDYLDMRRFQAEFMRSDRECQLLREQLAAKDAEIAANDASFELRWKADMRAIERWRNEDPGRDFTLPDHADLCVWLLQENERLRAALKAADRELINAVCDGAYYKPDETRMKIFRDGLREALAATPPANLNDPLEGQLVFVHGGVAQFRQGKFYTGMEDPRYERAIEWPVNWWWPIDKNPCMATPPANTSYLRCPYCIAGQCERCANDDICQCECRATAKPAEPRK